MKHLMLILISLTPFANASQFSERNCIKEGFLPENNMKIPVQNGMKTGVSERDFNDVIDKVEQIYAPIIRNYGGTLRVERLWDDATVNASARRLGSTYEVKMYGGLARHHTITKDAFALVACHEVGHHIGGVPRYTDPGGTWASVEGQSDYFATAKCLRKLFEADDNQSIVGRLNVPSYVLTKCEGEHNTLEDQLICQRIAMAGRSSASLFADMSNRPYPNFDTPDPRVVNRTEESHPEYQCRLDTYFQGALCFIDKDTEIGQRDPNIGSCNRRDNHAEGIRPLCWYKPSVGGSPNPNPGPNPTPIPTPTPPSSDIAPTPTANGATGAYTNDPDTMIPINFNVAAFRGAFGLAIEVSKANRVFSNPNGTGPDRANALWLRIFSGTSGTYQFVPRRELPGYGNYQIRVIGLDRNQRPVSKFSNTFELGISP